MMLAELPFECDKRALKITAVVSFILFRVVTEEGEKWLVVSMFLFLETPEHSLIQFVDAYWSSYRKFDHWLK